MKRRIILSELKIRGTESSSLAYLLLGLLEIEHDEIIVGEVCVGEHKADAVGGSGA
jgi:hypothetical protein